MARVGIAFSASTLGPGLLILLGAAYGGWWPLLALLQLSLITAVLDALVDSTEGGPSAFPAATALLVAVAGLHFLAMAAVLWALGRGMPMFEAACLILAMALFAGQISNACAHELIHRRALWLQRLGVWVYVSLLFGHHNSAHRLVHHTHVATPRDPNTARAGESLYAFLPRAWIGGFLAGLAAESARHGSLLSNPRHPYLGYIGGAGLAIGLACALGGAGGGLGFLVIALLAQLNLLQSDYVQHYGLRRQRGPDGRFEAVGPAHSWNAPHRASHLMMLAAPRHSAHHTRPDRGYDTLELPVDTEVPMLPHSLPVMSAIAMAPPLWRRMMDPRLARLAAAAPRR